eukprot:1199448-Pleurochrysis_carterae.AAC.1
MLGASTTRTSLLTLVRATVHPHTHSPGSLLTPSRSSAFSLATKEHLPFDPCPLYPFCFFCVLGDPLHIKGCETHRTDETLECSACAWATGFPSSAWLQARQRG